MKESEPLSFKLVLLAALSLMTMIIFALCYVATQMAGDNTKVLLLLGGGFSAGCAAIFGLLRRR